MDTIYIDIINFILVFLLIDFINGVHDNFIAKKIKSGTLTVGMITLSSMVLCILTSLSLVSKIALLIIVLLAFLCINFLNNQIKRLEKYKNVESGKEEFFSNQKVMVFVPHEDDEINLMGGVIEQYVKYGSDVYIVFSTNGDGDKRFDMSQMGYIRMNEAIKALSILGVPEKNIIFLGYGDGWDVGSHIYNTNSDEVVASTAGRTSTYGLKNHPAYSDGKNYTYLHFYDDIKQVILDYTPDVIFCIDYDTHNDHRALSMLFEKVMGDILKSIDYRPTIYKGFGYRTAWASVPDFDSINIISSVDNISNSDVMIYDWAKRTRIPVDINSIDRKLEKSKLYKVLSLYDSQKANESASRIINGDKVFWHRRTDSVLYNAEISISSGDKNKLTDFMLLDCNDLINTGKYPFDGVWHPDIEDKEKLISITLDKKTYISCIALYDNPSPNDNILNAVIALDNGTKIKTGRLNSYGDAIIIPIEKEVKTFTVKLDEYEGENFGLCEIEAYSSKSQRTPGFYKFTDEDDNFVYDYIVKEPGNQVLKIYSNHSVNFNEKELILRCDNKKCKAEISGDEIITICPVGEKCHVELLSQDNKLLDRIILRNPNKLERYHLKKILKQTKNYSYVKRVYKLIKCKISIK